LITLHKVTKIYDCGHYQVAAVKNIDLEVRKKHFVLIAGRSGSGKTTLLSLIGGLTRPTSGYILFEGSDIWALDDRSLSRMRNRRIGFIFQFASLIPTLTVNDNLKLAASFHEVDYDVGGRAKDLLALVGMSEKAEAYPNQLSGGQLKRVAIARALMNSPDLILADEPTGDLDEETEKEIVQILKKTNEDGATVVLVSHSPDIAPFATRRFRMSHGILTEEDEVVR